MLSLIVGILDRAPRLFSGVGIAIVIVSWLYHRYGSRLPLLLQYSLLFGKEELLTATQFEVLRISKKWFWCFYSVGLVATLFVLLLEVHQPVPRITLLCTLVVYLSHLCRRLYECRFVSVFGHGQMSLTHFIMGIAFYIVTPASLFASRLYTSDRSWTVMTLFILKTSGLQYAQHVVCKQLAELRKSPTGNSNENRPIGYYIPKGTMFRHISCPHYLYEIALYLTLHIFVSISWIPFSHMVLFVIFNQLCSAWFTHSWYQRQFPEWAANRKALLPFVW